MSPNGNYFSFHSYNHSGHPNIKKNDKKENRCVRLWSPSPRIKHVSKRTWKMNFQGT